MSLEDYSFDADSFSGVARLFPLPNLVVFPHIMQPLHLFEPRYRMMLEEAIQADRLIAMANLAPGWESNYEGRPEVLPTACLCRVATHCKTDKGTYNVLLLGIKRIRIARELPPKKLFREAKVQLLEDVYPAENDVRRASLQCKLVDAFRRQLPSLPGGGEQLQQLLATDVPLGLLTDIVSYSMPLDQKIKEDLLAQPLPDLRALLLLECLGAKCSAASERKTMEFPPPFSVN
jgi:uncharacterized protein